MPSYPIQLKRNGTASATPSSLLHGEVALNYADGKLFWKDASNVIQSFTFQAYAPTSHSHGNITNAGAIGSTANLPIITTTSGVLTTGSFGTSAATFCEGNDSRLSDTRTPTDGSVTTAKIANDAVTYAKLQNVSATDRLLGRSSAGSGDVEEILCGSFGRSLIGSADAAAARTTLSVQPTASPAFTGAATFDNTGNVVPLTVTNTGTANSFVVNDASGDTSPFVITSAGDVTIGTGRTVTGGSGGAFLASNGLNNDLVTTGRAAAITGTWGTLRVHQVKDYAGLRIIGDTSQTASYMDVENSSGTTLVSINSSGQLLVTAGSASACGVAFSGDVNTGLAQIGGADTASLVTAGVERVRCTSGGTIEVRANSGSISHGLTYNENGGEIVLYDETQTAATLIDQISTDTRVLELVNGSNLKLGLGSGNTTGVVSLMRAGYSESLRIKANGSVRFLPLTADPASPEAGDVYFNSSTSKLRVYTGTAWADLH